MTDRDLIPDGHALLVTGSLSAKPDDRTHDRTQIHPVLLVDRTGVEPVAAFDRTGPLGVSSFAFASTLSCWFSTGDDLFHLALDSGVRTPVPIDGLIDVHEMLLVDGELWLSNTGADEAIKYVPATGEVERVSLARFRGGLGPSGDDGEIVDRFHTNQIFVDEAGHRWALVHHTRGKQILRRVARKLLKTQGDGGVINLTEGRPVALGLTAPHTVRRVSGGWWVCDSGNAQIVRFDDNWEAVTTAATLGWGRGADLSPDGSRVFVGMSPIRKRYRSEHSGELTDVPLVEIFDAASTTSIGRIELPGIEQVNNVYVLPPATTEFLRVLPVPEQ